jgi:hypothetical protein
MMTDKLLAEACAELNEAMLRSLPAPEECDPRFSQSFQRKMARVTRRANHPIPYRVMQRVASFLLVLFLGFMTVLAVSPAARAAFDSWIRETYESFFVYTFAEKSNGPAPNRKYYISELPEGYVEIAASLDNYTGICLYTNEGDAMIALNYAYGGGSVFYVNKEGYTVKAVTVAGHPGEVYVDHVSDPSGIIWVDEEKQIMFFISAQLTEEELLALAESVKVK